MGATIKTTKQAHMDALIELVETLRGDNGCPWDRQQTPRSISVHMIEEVYELIEAIDLENPDHICEELGDVLFHICFLADIYQERGHFDIADVVCHIIEKMTRRHPHVFSDARLDNADEVIEQWDAIKLKEKKIDQDGSLLDSVPGSLPALMRAYTMTKKSEKAGFDWENVSGVMEKLDEELAELKIEIDKDHKDSIEMEYGDVLFTLVNMARFLDIHPETALNSAIRRFEDRFKHLEKVISKSGRSFESMSQDDMDLIWDAYKEKRKL